MLQYEVHTFHFSCIEDMHYILYLFKKSGQFCLLHVLLDIIAIDTLKSKCVSSGYTSMYV